MARLVKGFVFEGHHLAVNDLVATHMWSVTQPGKKKRKKKKKKKRNLPLAAPASKEGLMVLGAVGLAVLFKVCVLANRFTAGLAAKVGHVVGLAQRADKVVELLPASRALGRKQRVVVLLAVNCRERQERRKKLGDVQTAHPNPGPLHLCVSGWTT